MSHLERFNAWVAGDNAPGMCCERAFELAMELGHTRDERTRAIQQIRHWLAKNEHTGKANKKLWGKFFLTWLTPKSSRQTGRLEPSNFD